MNSPGNRRSAFRRDFCHGDILGVTQRAAVLIEVVSDPFAAHAIKLPCRRVIGKCELEHGVQFADVRWLNKANERFATRPFRISASATILSTSTRLFASVVKQKI